MYYIAIKSYQERYEVFNVPDELGLDNYTLLQALEFKGGSGNIGAAQILLRAAVAALLNEANGCSLPCGKSVTYVVNTLAFGSNPLERDNIIYWAEYIDASNNRCKDSTE